MAVAALECKYVTEEYVKEWKSTNTARKLSIDVPPARFVYELCWTVVKGELPQSKCRVALDSVGLTEPSVKDSTSSVLADTVAHMGQELSLPGESRSRLIDLAKWLVHIELVPVRLLQERCEAGFLWDAEMIRIKANELKSKEVSVNTRLLYQQTKFNLLREESEGYAKLLTLLCQGGPDGLTKQTCTAIVSTIKSLIGHFDLDPNRVFDIVLECFELQPENAAFLELIPLFPKVSNIKADEREDLKVLAIGIAAALATRKNSWVTDDEFTMGLLDIRPPSSPAKAAVGATSSGPASSSAAAEPSLVPSSGKSSGVPSVDTPVGSIDLAAPSALPPSSLASVAPLVRSESTSAPPVKNEESRGPSPASKPSSHVPPSDSKPAVVHLTTVAQASTRTSTAATSRNGPEVPPRTGSGHIAPTGVKVEEPSTKQAGKPVSADAEAKRPLRCPSQSGQAGTAPPSSRSAKSESQREDTTRVVPNITSVQTIDATRGAETSGSRQRPSSAGASSAVTNGSAGPTPTKSSSGRGLERSSQERARPSGDTSTVRTDSGQKVDASGSKASDGKGSGDRERERERERSEVQDVVVSQQIRPPSKSPRREDTTVTAKVIEEFSSKERQAKRTVGSEDVDRLNKRRKSDGIEKTIEVGELRVSERSDRVEQRPAERPRSVEHDRVGYDERPFERPGERSERVKERGGDRVDREYRVTERMVERSERERGEEHTGDRFRDRSIEKFTRERSVDRGSDRAVDRSFDRAPDRVRDDRGKDDRARPRYAELPVDQPHPDDRFPMQNLPPPPPLPPNVVPLTVTSRRDEEGDRRVRSIPRVSPRREEKGEKRRTDDVNLVPSDDPKRRREEELRDRKREEREMLTMKAEKEKEREKDKALFGKEEVEGSAALSKRRRLKRDHIPSTEIPTNFGPSPPPPAGIGPVYEGRDRDRKVLPRNVYPEEGPYDNKGPGGGGGSGGGGGGGRMHGKEAKVARREHEPLYDRDWEDEKRQRGDIKRHSHSRRK